MRTKPTAIIPVLLLAAGGGALLSTAATALPADASYQVSGNVARRCTPQTSTVDVVITKSGSGKNLRYDFATSPSVTISCNAPDGQLTVASTRLIPQSGSTRQDYSLTVSGWGTAGSFTTTAAANGGTRSFTEATTRTSPISFSTSTNLGSLFAGSNSRLTATLTLTVKTAAEGTTP